MREGESMRCLTIFERNWVQSMEGDIRVYPKRGYCGSIVMGLEV